MGSLGSGHLRSSDPSLSTLHRPWPEIKVHQQRGNFWKVNNGSTAETQQPWHINYRSANFSAQKHLQGVSKKNFLSEFFGRYIKIPILGKFGHFRQFWAFWAILGILGISGQIWINLWVFGHFWAYLGISGQFWAFLGKSGHFGQIWAF